MFKVTVFDEYSNIQVITELAPGTNQQKMRKLVQLVNKMSQSADAGVSYRIFVKREYQLNSTTR